MMKKKSGLKIEITGSQCIIEAHCNESSKLTEQNESKNVESTKRESITRVPEEINELKNSGELNLSNTNSIISLHSFRISKSIENLDDNYTLLSNLKLHNMQMQAKPEEKLAKNIQRRNEIMSESIVVEDEEKSKSSNSVYNNSCNNEKKNEISNRSIFCSPSTICNYYQPSNEVSPSKVDSLIPPKRNIKQLNLGGIGSSSNTNGGSSRSENASETKENISSKNVFSFFDRRTPIKYTKSQLRSGEKEKQKNDYSEKGKKKNKESDRKTSSFHEKSSQTDSLSPSPFAHIFNINSKTIDESINTLAQEIKQTFSVTTRAIDTGQLKEDMKEETSGRKNLIHTFDKMNVTIDDNSKSPQKINCSTLKDIIATSNTLQTSERNANVNENLTNISQTKDNFSFDFTKNNTCPVEKISPKTTYFEKDPKLVQVGLLDQLSKNRRQKSIHQEVKKLFQRSNSHNQYKKIVPLQEVFHSKKFVVHTTKNSNSQNKVIDRDKLIAKPTGIFLQQPQNQNLKKKIHINEHSASSSTKSRGSHTTQPTSHKKAMEAFDEKKTNIKAFKCSENENINPNTKCQVSNNLRLDKIIISSPRKMKNFKLLPLNEYTTSQITKMNSKKRCIELSTQNTKKIENKRERDSNSVDCKKKEHEKNFTQQQNSSFLQTIYTNSKSTSHSKLKNYPIILTYNINIDQASQNIINSNWNKKKKNQKRIPNPSKGINRNNISTFHNNPNNSHINYENNSANKTVSRKKSNHTKISLVRPSKMELSLRESPNTKLETIHSSSGKKNQRDQAQNEKKDIVHSHIYDDHIYLSERSMVSLKTDFVGEEKCPCTYEQRKILTFNAESSFNHTISASIPIKPVLSNKLPSLFGDEDCNLLDD